MRWIENDGDLVIEERTNSDGNGGLLVKLLQFFDVTRKKGLLDEERLVRFEQSSELLGHGLVNTTVEVEAGVHADALHFLQSIDGGLEVGRRCEPGELSRYNRTRSAFVEKNGQEMVDLKRNATSKAELGTDRFRSVHLDSGESLLLPELGLGEDIGRSVASDPAVDLNFVPNSAAKELPYRNAELLSLDIPESDVESGDSRHENRSTLRKAEQNEVGQHGLIEES